MADPRVLAVVAIVLVSGFAASAAAFSNAAYDTREVEVEVEDWEFDEVVSIPGEDINQFEAYHNDTELDPNGDYTLDDEVGTIAFHEGGPNLQPEDEGDAVALNYTATVPDQLAVTMRSPLAFLFVLGGLGFLSVGCAFLLQSLRQMRRVR